MENTTVTIGDLMVLRSAIDLASTRGAFRANEMSTIGATFDRLTAFLEEFESQQSTEETATEITGE